MTAPVSVIIAALNEERSIASAVESARAAGAAEVIVADGGSSDATVRLAQEAGALVIRCEPLRGRQFNLGAEAASNEYLIFLHADTVLPPNAALDVSRVLENGAAFGGFRISFLEQMARLRIAAFMINLRTAFTRCPWGDQAQFIKRSLFLQEGGFREMPLMEDYELAIRMKRRVKTKILRSRVRTSGRRFLRKGVLRTAAVNWRIIVAYRLGADPARLARLYKR
ncbi:MAG TPA: TIGR04283 family arsenosugar biosynthesis glycosyltransferase [Thermoanaerobaculia bacterium]|nr:TIGR04283 family arsenosugar biosynthesis glycosyltransferase [Thermoanaerobaculia bacterium]